jgi:hypothetical protein
MHISFAVAAVLSVSLCVSTGTIDNLRTTIDGKKQQCG